MKWLMLVYRLPRAKTTATKVSTWRRLKKLGAFPLQDSVFVLPFSEKNLHSFDWLAAELRETGGDASVWEAQTLTSWQERGLQSHFLEAINKEYRRIIREADRATSTQELKSLWLRYHTIKKKDHLNSPLAREAEAACERRAVELEGKEARD